MKLNNRLALSVTLIIVVLGLAIVSKLNFGASSDTALDVTATKTVYMYLYAEGETQGEIKGSVITKGHENSIEVLSYSHSILSPRDPASGLPTGKRQHKPIIITKEIDKSTPLLYNTLVNNENLVHWKLEFWELSVKGIYEMFFKIELQNANIAEISTKGSNFGATEQVSFTYQKIIWTWIDGGITAQDDWEAPTV